MAETRHVLFARGAAPTGTTTGTTSRWLAANASAALTEDERAPVGLPVTAANESLI